MSLVQGVHIAAIIVTEDSRVFKSAYQMRWHECNCV